MWISDDRSLFTDIRSPFIGAALGNTLMFVPFFKTERHGLLACPPFPAGFASVRVCDLGSDCEYCMNTVRSRQPFPGNLFECDASWYIVIRRPGHGQMKERKAARRAEFFPDRRLPIRKTIPLSVLSVSRRSAAKGRLRKK